MAKPYLCGPTCIIYLLDALYLLHNYYRCDLFFYVNKLSFYWFAIIFLSNLKFDQTWWIRYSQHSLYL